MAAAFQLIKNLSNDKLPDDHQHQAEDRGTAFDAPVLTRPHKQADDKANGENEAVK